MVYHTEGLTLTVKTKPWGHQLRALSYLYKRNAAALYTKPGSGKTKVFIDLIENRGFKRTLIVAPKKACDVWVSQIKIHSFMDPSRVFPLHSIDWEKKQDSLKRALDMPGDSPIVLICNYDSVWRKPLDRMLFYKKLGIDCVICDESHRIKSPSSKCSRFLSRLGQISPNRYLLTGTPLAENPTDVYAQYRFLDPTIFGTNFERFCDEYQNLDIRLSSRVGYRVLDKKNPYRNLDKLREKMFSCAFYIEPDIKLPKTTRMIVKIPMDQKTETLYRELSKEGAIETEDGFMTVNNALAMITRKQQLTSGYLPIEREDTGGVDLKRVSTYRRTFLYKFLKGLPEDEPVVVFAKFRKDLYSIRKAAERLGTGYSELSGSEDTLSEWKDGKTRVIGVQYTSGAESVDLTRAHICIFYTLDHSLAKYEQALKRIHRPGQENPCLYYHFVATMSSGRTIDQDILSALREKRDLVRSIMDGTSKG